ncbi:MMPL family transporter [Phytomonospora sp. NPDC050363]|uniref:MMPL family transporter n=1 Tax=Phytomonospora sp. NPDC050363 TaxID=3155642 RepID=UPI0033CB747E
MTRTLAPQPSPGAPPPSAPSRMERLAAWSQRRRWPALLLWVAVLAGVTVASQAIGTDYRDDHSLPGTESQAVSEAFEKYAPAESGTTVQIVFQSDAGLASQRAAITGVLGDIGTMPSVADVSDPFESPGSIGETGTIGFATATLDAQATDVPAEDVRAIIDAAKGVESDSLRVELGGDAVRGAEESAGGAAEGAGMLAALVILLFMFGSLLAAAVPLLTAVFAVGSTLGLIAIASNVFTLPGYIVPLMMLVGLGVGVDYALLIFTRFRGEIRRGAGREAAARTALDTAGRSVLFAGATVIIALLGLLALGLGGLQGVALGVALTVLVTMLASVTLLPALLSVLGKRIEARILRRAAKATSEPGARWRRWAALMQRRPLVPLLFALALLIALSAPALGMRLGFADAGTESAATTSRQAYDLLGEGFGEGFNGPLIVLGEGDEAAAEAAYEALRTADGVAEVAPPQPIAPGELSMLLVFPETAPQDEATADLVERLRVEVLPPVAGDTGATYLVGGSTAASVDFAEAVSDRMPLFLLVVVGLSALLLMAVFRSLLIPVKAAILNLLSIGASLGVITLVFQEGWFGVHSGPIEAFVPVMIFAIVFGLSMDYEVFLVSRMHEEWRRTADASHAVREGLATTGGVITAAGAIMIVVFGAFVLSPDRMLQQFGLGLAVAVLLDALVIRCLVVPTVMRLLGTKAWWLPKWLDRALPKIALEKD